MWNAKNTNQTDVNEENAHTIHREKDKFKLMSKLMSKAHMPHTQRKISLERVG